MRRNIKKPLKKVISSVTYTNVKVAGLIMQGLKKIWSNYQWVLALVALLYGIFLFYYQSTTATPARIKNCEERITAHITESDARLKKIESEYNDVKLSLARLEAMMDISLQDLRIMKGYITGEAHNK
jgi:CBS-domain-containing membrane protein